jgi:hypothetical protein
MVFPIIATAVMLASMVMEQASASTSVRCAETETKKNLETPGGNVCVSRNVPFDKVPPNQDDDSGEV